MLAFPVHSSVIKIPETAMSIADTIKQYLVVFGFIRQDSPRVFQGLPKVTPKGMT